MWLKDESTPGFSGWEVMRVSFGDDFEIATDDFEISIKTAFTTHSLTTGRRKFTPDSAAKQASTFVDLLLHRRLTIGREIFSDPMKLSLASDEEVLIEVSPDSEREAWRITWPEYRVDKNSLPGYAHLICPPGGQRRRGGAVSPLNDLLPQEVRALVERHLLECVRALGDDLPLPSTFSSVCWLIVASPSHWRRFIEYAYKTKTFDFEDFNVGEFLGLMDQARNQTLRDWPLVSFGHGKVNEPKTPYFLKTLQGLAEKHWAN